MATIRSIRRKLGLGGRTQEEMVTALEIPLVPETATAPEAPSLDSVEVDQREEEAFTGLSFFQSSYHCAVYDLSFIIPPQYFAMATAYYQNMSPLDACIRPSFHQSLRGIVVQSKGVFANCISDDTPLLPDKWSVGTGEWLKGMPTGVLSAGLKRQQPAYHLLALCLSVEPLLPSVRSADYQASSARDVIEDDNSSNGSNNNNSNNINNNTTSRPSVDAQSSESEDPRTVQAEPVDLHALSLQSEGTGHASALRSAGERWCEMRVRDAERLQADTAFVQFQSEKGPTTLESGHGVGRWGREAVVVTDSAAAWFPAQLSSRLNVPAQAAAGPAPLCSLKQAAFVGVHGWKAGITGIVQDNGGKDISLSQCGRAESGFAEVILNQLVLDAARLTLARARYRKHFSPVVAETQQQEQYQCQYCGGSPHDHKDWSEDHRVLPLIYELPSPATVLSMLGIKAIHIPLFGYGMIKERAQKLSEGVLPGKTGVLASSDIIWFNVHSQGTLVLAHLLVALMQAGTVSTATQHVWFHMVTGVIHGPYPDLPSDYLPATREQFRLGQPDSSDFGDAKTVQSSQVEAGVHMHTSSAWLDSVVPPISSSAAFLHTASITRAQAMHQPHVPTGGTISSGKLVSDEEAQDCIIPTLTGLRVACTASSWHSQGMDAIEVTTETATMGHVIQTRATKQPRSSMAVLSSCLLHASPLRANFMHHNQVSPLQWLFWKAQQTISTVFLDCGSVMITPRNTQASVKPNKKLTIAVKRLISRKARQAVHVLHVLSTAARGWLFSPIMSHSFAKDTQNIHICAAESFVSTMGRTFLPTGSFQAPTDSFSKTLLSHIANSSKCSVAFKWENGVARRCPRVADSAVQLQRYRDFVEKERLDLVNIAPEEVSTRHLFELTGSDGWHTNEHIHDHVVGLREFLDAGPNELHAGRPAFNAVSPVPRVSALLGTAVWKGKDAQQASLCQHHLLLALSALHQVKVYITAADKTNVSLAVVGVGASVKEWSLVPQTGSLNVFSPSVHVNLATFKQYTYDLLNIHRFASNGRFVTTATGGPLLLLPLPFSLETMQIKLKQCPKIPRASVLASPWVCQCMKLIQQLIQVFSLYVVRAWNYPYLKHQRYLLSKQPSTAPVVLALQFTHSLLALKQPVFPPVNAIPAIIYPAPLEPITSWQQDAAKYSEWLRSSRGNMNYYAYPQSVTILKKAVQSVQDSQQTDFRKKDKYPDTRIPAPSVFNQDTASSLKLLHLDEFFIEEMEDMMINSQQQQYHQDSNVDFALLADVLQVVPPEAATVLLKELEQLRWFDTVVLYSGMKTSLSSKSGTSTVQPSQTDTSNVWGWQTRALHVGKP